nr:hypothetical protein [Tanacetum cinerariifolium]
MRVRVVTVAAMATVVAAGMWCRLCRGRKGGEWRLWWCCKWWWQRGEVAAALVVPAAGGEEDDDVNKNVDNEDIEDEDVEVEVDDESEDEEADIAPKATARIVAQRPFAIRDFSRGIVEVGESSAACDSSYVGGLVPWVLRRDLETSRA